MYSAIYMVWCVGYLSRPLLIAFLAGAKAYLLADKFRTSRNKAPSSFIFVLDNVLKDDEDSYMSEGQLLRRKSELESIFARANLVTHKVSRREKMPGDNHDVMLWALY